MRTVISPPDRTGQKIPAIRVQHPSPEINEGEFERELVNGIGGKPLVNGGYFGEDLQMDGKVNEKENGVHL